MHDALCAARRRFEVLKKLLQSTLNVCLHGLISKLPTVATHTLLNGLFRLLKIFVGFLLAWLTANPVTMSIAHAERNSCTALDVIFDFFHCLIE